MKTQDISVYIHIPFCRRRCGYCDFNTFSGMDSYIDAYVDALCQEIKFTMEVSGTILPVHTIFLGGGTPSILKSRQLEKIIKTLDGVTSLSRDAEITLEANPETVTAKSLIDLRNAGFNRISFGMQSADKRDLEVLDRAHTHQSVINAVRWSKAAGFHHINLDLIYGIPGQKVTGWLKTLDSAFALEVDHYSAYALTVEEDTPLRSRVDAGEIQPLEDDLVGEMYEACIQAMNGRGYAQYEISNWAADEGSRCRHNLQYWRYLPYLGFGAGAHGFFGLKRTENEKSIPSYIQRIHSNTTPVFPEGRACVKITELTRWESLEENMMVSLRLTEAGVSIREMEARHGTRIDQVFSRQIARLLRGGLLEWQRDGDVLRLTPRGRLLGNRVFSEFIGNAEPIEFAAGKL